MTQPLNRLTAVLEGRYRVEHQLADGPSIVLEDPSARIVLAINPARELGRSMSP